MKGRMTAWQPSAGSGRWVRWRGSILRANQQEGSEFDAIAQDGIRMQNPIKGISVTAIPHLPFRSAALQRSVTRLIHKSSTVPDFKEGYDTWRQAYDAGKAGAFDTDVAATLDSLLGASWELKK